MSGGAQQQTTIDEQLFDILALTAQLSRLDVPLAFVHEALLDSADKLCKSAEGGEDSLLANMWQEYTTNHYRALHCASCLSDTSLFEEQTDALFAAMLGSRNSKFCALVLREHFTQALRVGDISTASVLTDAASQLPLSEKPLAPPTAETVLTQHSSALVQWSAEFQRPIDVRFYERFLANRRRASSAIEMAQLRQRICSSRSIGNTIVHLIGEWRCKVEESDRHRYWLLQSERWRNRTSDDVVRVFADADIALDARLRMVMLTLKFLAQTMLLQRSATSAKADNELRVPLFDTFGNVLLVWTLACYERFYRVLVLQLQARSAQVSQEAREIFETIVHKLASLADNVDAGNANWNHAAFFDDFLVSFEDVVYRVPLDPHDRRALLCAVRTTHGSLRVLNRFFVQVSCCVVAAKQPHIVYTPAIDELLSSGLVAQQRAVQQIAAQTLQLAKLCALLVT